MKKRIFAIAVACVLALSFALVGCGGGNSGSAGGDSGATTQQAQTNPADNFVGTWEVSGMVSDGQPYSADDLQAMKDMGMNIILTLNEDGSATIDMFGEILNGSWDCASETDGTLTFEGDSVSITVSDGTLTFIVDDNNSMSFTRTNAATTGNAAATSAGAGAAGAAAGLATSSSSNGTDWAVGTWTLYEITDTDEPDEAVSPEEVQQLDAMGMTVTMTLNEDGTGSMDMFGEPYNVTWEDAGGGTYTIYLEGSPATAMLADAYLCVVIDDTSSMIFAKA